MKKTFIPAVLFLFLFGCAMFSQMEDAGGAISKNKDTKLYNKIDSPGSNMRVQDGE